MPFPVSTSFDHSEGGGLQPCAFDVSVTKKPSHVVATSLSMPTTFIFGAKAGPSSIPIYHAPCTRVRVEGYALAGLCLPGSSPFFSCTAPACTSCSEDIAVVSGEAGAKDWDSACGAMDVQRSTAQSSEMVVWKRSLPGKALADFAVRQF